MVSKLVELLGFAAIVAGIALACGPAAALIFGGIFLVLLAEGSDYRKGRS